MLSPERVLMHRVSLPENAKFRVECFEGRAEDGEKWKAIDIFLEHPDGTMQLLYTADCTDGVIRSMLFEDIDAEKGKELVIELRKERTK